VDIHAKEILRIRERLNEILMRHSGQTREKIEHDTDRDFIMTAAQGLEYGVIDQVISKRE
jgi:ATP-dependent Clp protease protease subunit